MVKRSRGTARLRRPPTRGLQDRLDEAEATLEAIRTGAVDALVLSGPDGELSVAIHGATHPFHLLLNTMSNGAALLARDGTILFSNARVGELARAPVDRLHGSRFQRLLVPSERRGFEEFLEKSSLENLSREFWLAGAGAPATPISIALSTVPLGTSRGKGASVVMAIIADLSERKQAEVTRQELMKRLLSAEDEERRRIARELHDETGQSLSALLVGLLAIEEQADSPVVRATAQRLRSIAAETVDNVGRLARGLHPAILDDLGLAAAAGRHAKDFAESFGIPVDLRVAGNVAHQFPSLVQTTVYRILQEGLTNVARHAEAGAASVELTYEKDVLELVIRDDGIGFDVNAATEEVSGLGLHGMRERVKLLGGSLDIESHPGQGTLVRARIPAGPPPPPPETPSRTESRTRVLSKRDR